METYYDNLSGEMWSPDEKLLFQRKKKAPVVINDLKPAERTILGLFIQNKYDVKFAPREETQDISDVLQRLYAWTAYTQDWAFKDIELVRQAWCGGVAYQEIYVKVTPGQEPAIMTNTINPFSIAWDPESRDLINREDAQFVDRDTWVTYTDLAEMWPDKIQSEDDIPSQGRIDFQQKKTYADRSAQYYDVLNNRYRVTERYYKVHKANWKASDGKQVINLQEGADRTKYEQEGFKLHRDTQELLYVAILCPAWNSSEYLYNGPYHCQPQDLFTKKVIFPFVELVAESINGVPGGYVQHLVQINRLKNSAVSNLFHAQKHASSTALIRKRKLFGADETQAASFDKNHSDADRVFVAQDQADLSADISAVPKGLVSQDSDKTLDIASNSFQAISSTPPALQGQAESSSTSGILNSQRIEQSFVQLQVLIANIKHFLKRRAELVYYYWREYFTYPMKVRILGDQQSQAAGATPPPQPGQPAQPGQAPGQPMQGQSAPPTHVTINQEVPATDWQGNPTGAINKINDINAARYDISIEDSFQSPTYRAKVQQQIGDLLQKPNLDPALYSMLMSAFIASSDVSKEIKDMAMQNAKTKSDQANQPPGPPPPKPPNISYAFKGTDLNNQWVQAIIAKEGVLDPQTIQQLQQQPVPPPTDTQPPEAPAAPAQPAPEPQPTAMELQKHEAEMKLHAAKLEGAHLDNAMKTQKIADAEATVNASLPGNSTGLAPAVEQSFNAHPTPFGPRVPTPGAAPTQKHIVLHRGVDGKIAGATVLEGVAS